MTQFVFKEVNLPFHDFGLKMQLLSTSFMPKNNKKQQQYKKNSQQV